MLLFSVVIIVISASISTVIAYFYSRNQLEKNLAVQLLNIVNATAPGIGGKKHENIYLSKEGEIKGWHDFLALQKELIDVKQATGIKGRSNSSPLYTMRKTKDFDKTGLLEFVVMTDKDEEGRYFVGARIKAEPHHLQALNGKSSVTGIYKDVEGFWISAASPIKDDKGNVVAILQADYPIQYYNRKLYELAAELSFGALVSVFVALLLAVLFARAMVHPIKKLVTAAEYFGAGDLSHRLSIERRDELGVLAKSFNVMADKIQKNRENLEGLVDERTRDLQIMKEKAESASRAKSSFLANMSHELRTPLNAVIGLSEMLVEDARDSEDEVYIEPLERIHGAGKHLLQLINDILDLSKVEAGKMELLVEKISLKSVIKDVEVIAAPLASKNKNKLVIDYDESLDDIKSDSTRLKQVLLNLISNACKFTENGTVTLAVSEEKDQDTDWLLFSVTDTGIGMTPEQMEKIFEKFTQADATTTSKYGGTGLGLPISRKICQLMGGDINVTSEMNVGTTFTAKIPRYEVGHKDEGKSFLSTVLFPGYKREQLKTKPHSSKILIIEDDVAGREVMMRYLEDEGYHVMLAGDGESGIRLAKDLVPGAILLDIMLPDISGWDVLSEIKKESSLADTLVIMVSALDEKNKGFALGATDYMVKPINKSILMNMINKYKRDEQPNKVLVVDDDEDVRLYLRKILEKDHWIVEEAENGKIALDKVGQDKPGVVLLDLMMPVMDGFEFLEKLRKTDHWGDIPIIVVTSKSLTKEDHDRLNNRVIQILHKGEYEAEELRESVKHALSRYLKPNKKIAKKIQTKKKPFEK